MMVIRKIDWKTECWVGENETILGSVIELCAMVDKRDEIINNANTELLKRGCRISELGQELAEAESAKTARGHVIESLNIDAHAWTCRAFKDGDRVSELEEELKCLKTAKNKTDAENTRLWALDKNEMHRKYEELLAHNVETENAYRRISRENYDIGRQVAFLKQKCEETDVNISFTLSNGD